jgi:uncharacterized SAM-binding protein YcdF (DUF218 family)
LSGGSRSGITVFLAGVLAGALCVIGTAAWLAFHLADLLVVDSMAQPAEVAVVLGGGGGSRLHKALELYEQGIVGGLVLVDEKEKYWDTRLARQCPDCKTGGKRLTILSGSESTLTDALLVHKYCIANDIKKLLVVTDPYHTRRASLAFNRQFADSGIEVKTLSSGDYRDMLSPSEDWWRDEVTLRVVGTEAAKIAVFLLLPLMGTQYGYARLSTDA